MTCAVNIKNDDMMAQWALYCRQYGRGDASYSLPEKTFGSDLKDLETEYHCLDLYYQISRKTRRTYDEDYLAQRKMELEAIIDEQLMRYKNRTSRRCARCGRYLPPDCTKLCPACKIRWKKG